MKQQLVLSAILFIVMGCNNSPNAEQTSNQQNQQIKSVDTLTNTSETPEESQIDNDIRAIDKKIAELEEAEKLRIAEEINLIQQKIVDLDVRENEIESAIARLEKQIYQAETIADNTQQDAITTKSVTTPSEPELATIEEPADQETIASTNQNSVFGWGDWEKGIQPAAGGPGPVAVARFDVEKPHVNFRPNEHSAFHRSVIESPADNIPSMTADEISQLVDAVSDHENIVPITPDTPVSTTGPATGGF